MVYGNEPVEVPGGDIIYGDLNEDGMIDSVDAALLSRYILEISDGFPAPLESADLNGDGVVDSIDAVILGRYVLEIITSFPVNK